MDISKILQSLKGKVLDATHFDLLKHAYELQEENIKQLKTNNEALKESHRILSDKVLALEIEQENLENEVSEIHKTLPKHEKKELSKFAKCVLDVYIKHDTTALFRDKIVQNSGLKNIEAEAGIAELVEIKHLFRAQRRAGGLYYQLSSTGKSELANAE